MKKLVLLLAVVFSASLFSCGSSDKKAEAADSVAPADSAAAVVDSAAVVADSVAPADSAAAVVDSAAVVAE